MALFKNDPEKRIKRLRLEYDRKKVNQQAKEEKYNHLPNHEDAFVCFNNVQKVYPNGVHSVIDFNLDIKQGEFVVFVGPSGCGKTTTLRMVCGLEDISAGALYIDGVYSNELPPVDRGVSMVFQNYALFPHLTVYENIAYGLKIKKVLAPKLDENGNQIIGIDENAIKALEKEKAYIIKHSPDQEEELNKIDHDINEYLTKEVPLFERRKLTKNEIDEKVKKAATILNLTELLERKPGQLSGGQCQRVALGRVIVSDAKLLLMDEPLSNLDAKLRVSMRGEIINLHKQLGATTIYVTHDQVEAMTMSDRVVVMSNAKIMQIGTPEEVYEHPNCLFVATFIGSPNMNILNAYFNDDAIYTHNVELLKDKSIKGKLINFYNNLLAEEKEKLSHLPELYQETLLEEETKIVSNKVIELENILATNNFPIKFGIRPEDLKLAENNSKFVIEGEVLSLELLGEEYHVFVKIDDERVLTKLPLGFKGKVGDKISLSFNMDKAHYFDNFSGKVILN